MGLETNWQRELSRRWLALQQRRAVRDDRAGPRRSAVVMLLSAGLLGLAALYLGRTVATGRAMSGGVPTVKVVVAATAIGFGEQLTPDRLALADWPAAALPAGSFSRIDALAAGVPRAALRPIPAGEIVLASALAGGSARLASAPLLGPDRRAIAVPVNEVSGVSGLVLPGDRVDIFFARTPEDALPHAELIAQNLRVLAVGQDMNVGKERPEPVRTATIEVTALQAQKLTLAMGIGSLNLALRPFGDEARVRLQSLQLSDLNDGTTTRLLAKSRAPQTPVAPTSRPAAGAPPAIRGPMVLVMRGGETQAVAVLP